MKYDIRIYGDPVLREKAKPVSRVDGKIKQLADDMIEVMRQAAGCGLAAQQIGKAIAICVVEVLPEYDTDPQGQRVNPDVATPMVLINPEIVRMAKKTNVLEEGCLSFPDIRGNIERSYEIDVKYVNSQGQSVEQTLRGFVARVVQHEVDHLNGVLFIDRMSAAKRMVLGSKLKRLKKKTEENLDLA